MTADPPRDRTGILRSVGMAIYLPSALFGIGQGAIVPVVALSALDLGASVPVAAAAVAATGLGRILGDVPAGILAARIGERRAMVVAGVVAVAALVVCLFAAQTWQLCLGLTVLGMSTAVWGLARLSFIAENIPYALRGRALSMLGGMQRVGLFIGPFLTAAVSGPLGVKGGYWIHVAAALLAVGLLVVVRDPAGEPRAASAMPVQHVNPLAEIRKYQALFLTLGFGSLLISAVRASRQVLIPLWADHVGLDPAAASIIFGISGAAEIVAFYPGGYLMDRFGRRWVAVTTMAGIGASLVLLPLTSTAATIAAVGVLMGATNGLGSGVNMTIGADVSPAVGRSTFLGVWRLCTDVGNGMGPVVVSVVTAAATLGAASFAVAVLAATGAAIMHRWTPREPRA